MLKYYGFAKNKMRIASAQFACLHRSQLFSFFVVYNQGRPGSHHHAIPPVMKWFIDKGKSFDGFAYANKPESNMCILDFFQPTRGERTIIF